MKTASRIAKWEAKKMVRNNNKTRTQYLTEKVVRRHNLFLFKYFALVVQGCNYYTEPDIVLLINYFELFGGGTRLAMSKTICAPDTSSLKPGSSATDGVLD